MSALPAWVDRALRDAQCDGPLANTANHAGFALAMGKVRHLLEANAVDDRKKRNDEFNAVMHISKIAALKESADAVNRLLDEAVRNAKKGAPS
jgi:hypothetical protein